MKKIEEFLRAKLLEKSIILQSIRDTKEKHGRYLAVIWLDGININELLVSSGHAVHHEY